MMLSWVAVVVAGVLSMGNFSDIEGCSPGDGRANVPVKVNGFDWWLQIPAVQTEPVALRFVEKPASVTLGDEKGTPLPHSWLDGTLQIPVAGVGTAGQERLIKVHWEDSAWTKDMKAFEEQDKQRPPVAGGIVFAGSSTIRMWNLERCFPGLGALNRGFGGSQYVHLNEYVDRVIWPYAPKMLVLYSGDNDLANGKSPEWVFADFVTLMNQVRFKLPDTRILVFGTKPSRARWQLWPSIQAFNAKVAAYAVQNVNITFCDGAPALLGTDGQPRMDLFCEDGLHLNDAGYDAWSALVRPLLQGK